LAIDSDHDGDQQKRAKTNNPARHWVFTDNDEGSVAMWRDRLGGGQPGDAGAAGSNWPECVRYCTGQLEEGEQGLHRHLQGYLELSKPQRLSWLKAQLSGTAHWEPRRGTREQARDYARKSDTRVEGPWEYGDWQAGGRGELWCYIRGTDGTLWWEY